jgi:hypothetical protein
MNSVQHTDRTLWLAHLMSQSAVSELHNKLGIGNSSFGSAGDGVFVDSVSGAVTAAAAAAAAAAVAADGGTAVVIGSLPAVRT